MVPQLLLQWSLLCRQTNSVSGNESFCLCFAERLNNFDVQSAGQEWRIVFDCSASTPGNTFLKARLLPGPNLNPDIVQLLLNFRTQPVALSADIAKVYIMINVHESGSVFGFRARCDVAPFVRTGGPGQRSTSL